LGDAARSPTGHFFPSAHPEGVARWLHPACASRSFAASLLAVSALLDLSASSVPPIKAVEDQWAPLDPDLLVVLLALPRQGKKVFRFAEGRSGKPVGDRAVGNRISELARQAGVRRTMKSLRAGFGCRYAGKAPAPVLQRLMRHANIRTTMDYSTNVDDATMEAALGPQRNISRNIGGDSAAERKAGDASASEKNTSAR